MVRGTHVSHLRISYSSYCYKTLSDIEEYDVAVAFSDMMFIPNFLKTDDIVLNF